MIGWLEKASLEGDISVATGRTGSSQPDEELDKNIPWMCKSVYKGLKQQRPWLFKKN